MSSEDSSPPPTGGHGVPSPGPQGNAIGADRAWELAAQAGIRPMRIPTPFAVGRVNTYLLEDDPLTLIDTGPNSGKALDELERQLAGLGHSIEEIELLVLTHQHIDHTGLAEIVAKRSGAEVAAIDILAPLLADYSQSSNLDDDHAAELMLRHGIPEDVVVALRAASSSVRAWGSSAIVTRELRDGERLALRDRELEVQLRPGHSPTDTLLWDARQRILIGGDHLIAHISSNPLLTRPIDGSSERPRALIDYIDGMRRTRELPAEVVLAGHGEPVADHAALIDSRLAMHERRARRLHGLISERPMTAYELARSLWGDLAVAQAFLTLSEVVGHLDLLVEREQAVELDEGDIVRFAAAAGG